MSTGRAEPRGKKDRIPRGDLVSFSFCPPALETSTNDDWLFGDTWAYEPED